MLSVILEDMEFHIRVARLTVRTCAVRSCRVGFRKRVSVTARCMLYVSVEVFFTLRFRCRCVCRGHFGGSSST